MFPGILRLESLAASHTRGHRYWDQVEFEERLDRRRRIRNGLKLARRYRPFYRRNCNLHELFETTRLAAKDFRRETVLYGGYDWVKSQILFRWLRNEAHVHGLEITLTSEGVIFARW